MRLRLWEVVHADDRPSLIHALLDPGSRGVEAVPREGRPGGPPVPRGRRPSGTVSLLLSALGRGRDADALLAAAAGRRK